MLTLKTVRWGNCFSYGDNNELQLDSNKITQLVGENGSGKSSVALIIQEVLFNKNIKGIKKTAIANRKLGGNSYWMELLFTEDADEYIMRVERKSSVKVRLTKNGEDISSHTATDTFKSIEKVFGGMAAKIFFQLSYQSTKTGLDFLTATDSNRKKFLIELFTLDEYAEYYAMFKDLAADISNDVSRIRGAMESTQKWLARNSNVAEPIEKVEVPALPDINEKENKLWSLKDKATNAKDINRKIANNNKLKQLLNTITYNAILAEKDTKDLSYLTEKVGGLEASKKAKKAFLDKMKKLGSVCPTCEQPIDEEKIQALIKEATEEFNKLVNEIAWMESSKEEIAAENKRIKEAKKAKDEKESILSKIDLSMEDKIIDTELLEEDINKLEREILSVKKEYENAIKVNQKADEHNTKIKVMLAQIAEHEKDIAELREELAAVESEFSRFEVLKKVFSNNGLVAYKIESLVKDIEDLANDYLAELSDGKFTLTFTVSSDKLNVELTDEGEEIEITALSAGELSRVNTAMLLAIRKMMNSISKTQINILFLDEIVGVLDDYGREKLVEVLLQEENLNTFLVSHEWSHPLLEKVRVVKEDNISRLQFN